MQLNANRRMFVASTMKSMILCERLRQLDSPTVEKKIADHELASTRPSGLREAKFSIHPIYRGLSASGLPWKQW